MGDDTSFYSQQDPNDYASSVYSVEDFPTSETAISSQADDRGGQPSFVVCLFCLLFLGIVALIIFLMSTVIIDIDDRDDGAGGGGGDVKDDIKDVPYPGTIYSKPTVTKPVTSRPSPRRPATTPPVSTAAPSRPTPPVSSTLPPTVVLPPVSTTSSNARIKSTGYSRRSPLTTPTTTTGATTTTTKKKATTTARMSTTPTTSTSRFPELRQMLCSVGRTAIAETMYPPEGLCTYLFYTDVVIVDAKIVAAAERNSWNLFQTKAKKYNTIKSGIAFDHRYISTKLISEAMGELTMLATNKIGSYGLLNIITKPTVLHQTVLALRPAIEALKNIQGSDPGKTTVIAIGSYDYSGSGFMAKYKDIFAEVVGTFKADIVIAISSVGSMEDEANCYAAPPNVLTSPILRFPSMESHWPLVRHNATYANGETLVGLSFEMGALIYVLKQDAKSLNDSAYASCMEAGMTSQDAICTFSKNVDKKNQWLKEPYMVYGTYIHNNTKRHVAFSEYFTSVREKYTKAVRIFGSLHHRSALLMFNVHLGDVRKKCSVDAFSAIQWICHDFLGQRSCG
ncbi:uncharacterized protein [Dermacentor albipictus]|uniref:uncharacterized protein isoform X2 n=1 Tax=Dermacentor albipictus TaxID=60249 RepID=UPI0038FCD2A0